jgi:periplasmic protein TonB
VPAAQPAPALSPAPKPAPKPEPAPAVDVKVVLAKYAAGVKAAILAQKYYPPAAERLGHTGDVKVSFTVDAGGSLARASIKSSSGYDELDNAALDAVRRAAPFPAIPAEAGRDNLALSITLSYTVQ